MHTIRRIPTAVDRETAKKYSRREFFKKLGIGAGTAAAGAGIVGISAKHKMDFNKRVNFFSQYGKSAEDLARVSERSGIPLKKLPELKLGSDTLMRVGLKAKELKMADKGIERVLETIRLNYYGDRKGWEIQSESKDLEKSAQARRVLNILDWVDSKSLSAGEKKEIFDFVFPR